LLPGHGPKPSSSSRPGYPGGLSRYFQIICSDRTSVSVSICDGGFCLTFSFVFIVPSDRGKNSREASSREIKFISTEPTSRESKIREVREEEMLRETTRRETRAVIQKPEASISRSAPSLLPSTAAHVPEREFIPQSSRSATKVHDYPASQVCTVSILSLP